MRICVIIPAYNEEKAIQDLVISVKKYAPDILVINDGSTDKTEELAKAAGAVVLTFKNNAGKGKVVKDGFDYALQNNYDAVIMMDADGQHSPGDLPGIIDAAAPPKVGIVVGNRMANPKNMPALRFATNFLMSLIISLICRQNIPDSQCGFKLIKSGVLKKTYLLSSNYEIDSELLIKASHSGFKIASAPVKSIYEGQLSLINPFLDTWRFFVMLCRILLT